MDVPGGVWPEHHRGGSNLPGVPVETRVVYILWGGDDS